MARTLIQRMRQERAALFVQRNWRGLMGRRRYAMKRKEEWAVRLLQRNWRGKAGRESYLAKREERNAAMMLQRISFVLYTVVLSSYSTVSPKVTFGTCRPVS